MVKHTAKSSEAAKAASRSRNKTLDPSKSLDAAPKLGERFLNVLADAPDLRDRIYEPALLDLALTMSPPDASLSPIRDQKMEGACTGFALSSAITLMNRLRYQRLATPAEAPMVSARMLYEMAKICDEWPGEDYEGSSIRAALKGFYNNGVCRDDLARYRSGETGWRLTKDQAVDARNVGLGAYYRLRPEIIDYHAALNEAGVVYASAKIHRGWQVPKSGGINPSNISLGGHAFIIVGYDKDGFLIQNSWGKDWGGLDGRPGIARWLYEDWAATVMDAWVFRLSVPTPEAFDLTRSEPTPETVNLFAAPGVKAPRQGEIVGHFIHLNDGELVETGKYPSPISSIRETADFLADETATAKRQYKHLLFYAHGGLNGRSASANRVRKMKEVFKRNGIYPVHFMWETGFFETLGDVIFRANTKTEGRVGGWTDFTDRVLEALARKPGRAVWRDMKADADRSFARTGGGRSAVQTLLKGNAKRGKPLKVHFVGHSAGAIFLAQMLKNMDGMNPLKAPVQSCSLLAPACTIDLFKNAYFPNIGKSGSARGISKMWQYNLIDQRERDDTVGPYRKSLLYFVSKAFEDRKNMPLLGMEEFSRKLTLQSNHTIHYAGRAKPITDSDTHGGFDNDRATMNNVLKNILGKKPTTANGFQPEDVTGY